MASRFQHRKKQSRFPGSGASYPPIFLAKVITDTLDLEYPSKRAWYCLTCFKTSHAYQESESDLSLWMQVAAIRTAADSSHHLHAFAQCLSDMSCLHSSERENKLLPVSCKKSAANMGRRYCQTLSLLHRCDRY